MTEWSVAHTTAELSVCLLGPPRVEWAGCALAIARRQARALLYRLAVHLHPVPREQLCGLFYPNIPKSVARRDLSGWSRLPAAARGRAGGIEPGGGR